MKLAVFDFDSTLMDGETLEIISRVIGIDDQIKEITDKAMRGELDFFESLTMRVAMLKGISINTVNKICENLPIMNGAKETILELKKRGYKVVCFSGGFKNATELFAQELKLDADFSNIFHTKDGQLSGLVGGEMMFGDSKGIMIQKLQRLLNVTYENTIAIGDGANDLSMFKYAGKRISFCGKPVLERNANIIIKEKNLSELLQYLT